MLWLCLHLPHLPLSALGTDGDSPIVDQHGPHRWLITGTGQVRAGTPLAQALMLEPALRTRVRRPDAEQAALSSLAHAAYAYGHPVCAQIQDLHEPGRVPRALLWVEIGNSLQLFGGRAPLCDALCAEWTELGHVPRLGIAPTRAGAALLACTDPGPTSASASTPALDLQTLRAQLDYGTALARTSYGVLGVKVWIFKGEYGPGETTNGLLPVRTAASQSERSA